MKLKNIVGLCLSLFMVFAMTQSVCASSNNITESAQIVNACVDVNNANKQIELNVNNNHIKHIKINENKVHSQNNNFRTVSFWKSFTSTLGVYAGIVVSLILTALTLHIANF